MSDQDEDMPFLKAWRGAARETPDALLDARILQAARAQARHRFLVPMGALLAACLVLVFYRMQQQLLPAPKIVALDTSTFGLYVGRETHGAADADTLRQIWLRQQPGGSLHAEVVYP